MLKIFRPRTPCDPARTQQQRPHPINKALLDLEALLGYVQTFSTIDQLPACIDEYLAMEDETRRHAEQQALERFKLWPHCVEVIDLFFLFAVETVEDRLPRAEHWVETLCAHDAAAPSMHGRKNVVNDVIVYAAKYGHLALLKRLVSCIGVEAVSNGANALFLAADHGHLPVVKYLVTLPCVDATADNNHAVAKAASRGHLDIVTFLVSLPGVNPADDDNRAIRWAAQLGHLHTVTYLASLPGVNPAGSNNSPFIQAALNNHVDIVVFLASCPSVQARTDKYIALCLAAGNGHLPVVKTLIAIINPNDDECGRAIGWAARNGRVDMVIFLASIANPAAHDNAPIRLAARYGHVRVVEFLLTQPGVSRDAALHAAKQRKQHEVIALLEG